MAVQFLFEIALSVKNDQAVGAETVLANLCFVFRRGGIQYFTLQRTFMLFLEAIHDGRDLRAVRSARHGVINDFGFKLRRGNGLRAGLLGIVRAGEMNGERDQRKSEKYGAVMAKKTLHATLHRFGD